MAYDHGAFRVTNLERAIQFYTDKLGFTLLSLSESEEYGEKGAFLAYKGARLELLETIGSTYEPAVPKRPYCPHLCFETDDMDKEIARLQESGIPILDGPNEIPGSERWLYFMDPDMNVLEYILWIKEETNEN